MKEFRVCFINRFGEVCKGGWCKADDFTLNQMVDFSKSANDCFTNGWYLEFRGGETNA